MTFEEALATLESLWQKSYERSLTPLERSIFEVAWHQESYVSLAERLYLTEGHVKDTAADLWKQLSAVMDVKITKRTFRGLVEQSTNRLALASPLARFTAEERPATFPAAIDWADAPDTGLFLGRQTELQTLEQWMIQDRCRVVTLLGIGGIGKTALAAQLGRRIQEQFDFVIWRSLLNAPSLADTLRTLIGFFSRQQTTKVDISLDEHLLKLLSYLRQSRCLIVLDNVDTILAPDAGQAYRSGYEDYDQLLRRLGETAHKSCLLLTSRALLPAITRLEGPHKTVRTLKLEGLNLASGQQILQAFGLATPQDKHWTDLVQLYHGHPLALELAAKHIEAVFFGDIAEFLTSGTPVFGDIQPLLDWHMQRLSEAEIEALYWLAIHREPTALADLRRNILRPQHQTALPATLQSLHQHLSLVKSQQRFALQPVILEHVTACWVQQATTAVLEGDFATLDRYALLTTTAKDYVQAAQRQLILQPVSDRCLTALGAIAAVKAHIHQLFAKLRAQPRFSGYAAGNLLNMLCQLDAVVGPCDCSKLTLRHAYLQGMTLAQVDFAGSHFQAAAFTQAFGDTTAVAFNTDGSLLAAAHSNGEITVFRVEDGQLQQILRNSGISVWIWGLRFMTHDQHLISAGADSKIRFWNRHTGQCDRILQDGFLSCTAIVDGPDPNQLISSHDDGRIRIWDLMTNRCQRTIETQTGWIWSLALAPEGQHLASGGYGTLHLWDMTTGDCHQTFVGHQTAIKTIRFASDDVMITGSDDGCVKFWEVATGNCLHTLGPYPEPANAIALDPASDRLFVGVAGTLRCWDIATKQCLWMIQVTVPLFESLSFHAATQQLASGHRQQMLKLWNIKTQQCLRTWQGYYHLTSNSKFDSSGRYLLTGHNAVVRLWEVETATCCQTFHGHQDMVWGVAFHPDGERLISCSGDGTLKFWHRDTGTCLQTFATAEHLWCMVLSPDGRWLAVGSQNGTIFGLDLVEGKTLKRWVEDPLWILSLAFSPDSRLLASGHQTGIVKLWEVDSDTCLQTLDAGMHAFGVTFSPDGQTLAGTVNNGIHFWDVATGELRSQLKGDQDAFHSVAYTPDGQHLITGDYNKVLKVWDLKTMQCLRTDNDFSMLVGCIAMTPDGESFVTNTANSVIKLQSVLTGDCLKTFKIPGPYEAMKITGVTGMTAAQMTALKVLGAFE